MFELVKKMNEAFQNPEGDPKNINWVKVRNQAKNILDEFAELMIALGADPTRTQACVSNFKANLIFFNAPQLDDVRDALCDINVFSLGTHHFMGIDANRDMQAVIEGVMTRFVKDEADYHATIKMHRDKGVTDVYPVGEFPTMIIKSARDQKDAPKGKFLKSASFKPTVFYRVE